MPRKYEKAGGVPRRFANCQRSTTAKTGGAGCEWPLQDVSWNPDRASRLRCGAGGGARPRKRNCVPPNLRAHDKPVGKSCQGKPQPVRHFCLKRLHLVVLLRAAPCGKGLRQRDVSVGRPKAIADSCLQQMCDMIIVTCAGAYAAHPSARRRERFWKTEMWRRAWIPMPSGERCWPRQAQRHGAGKSETRKRRHAADARGNTGAGGASDCGSARRRPRAQRVRPHRAHRLAGSGKEAAPGDTVDRVFPIGTGDVRVELDRNGKPADAAAIEQQWRSIEKALAQRSNPDDPAIRPEYSKRRTAATRARGDGGRHRGAHSASVGGTRNARWPADDRTGVRARPHLQILRALRHAFSRIPAGRSGSMNRAGRWPGWRPSCGRTFPSRRHHRQALPRELAHDHANGGGARRLVAGAGDL